MAKQFSIAYDVYVQIRNEIQRRVATVLKRDTDKWRLRNACSACTYKLKDEQDLKFAMLVAMDGNNSLKRVLRKGESPTDGTSEGDVVSVSCELPDPRKPTGDYYRNREEVDRFSDNTGRGESGNVPAESDVSCAQRWTNMDNEKTSRMWGVFDESGIFISLCRHGYVLVAVDMVQSGEQ